MTLTNSVAAKLTVAFVAIAMAFSLVAPAQAQTAEELQATIDSLMAQINSLNSQIGAPVGNSAASVCPYAWTRSLNMGATGADVMALQQFLNGAADTQVAAAGSAGSPGMETSYYGPATGAAVAKFQAKYRTDILSPLGLVNPTTFFGPSTMAKANSLCVSAPVMDDDMDDDDDMMDDDDDMMDDDDDDDTLRGGEADVEDYDFSDEEDEAAEGEEDVPVLNVEFDVEDGDVRLERIDVVFDSSAVDATNGEDEPWEAFDEVSVWIDGDKVASEDVTDEDDWDELTGTDLFEFRLTNIDSIFREDTTGEVIIAVSVQGGVDVDGDANDDDWDVYIPEDGFRFVDGEGLDIEGPNSDGAASTFEIIEEGENDDLSLDSSDEDPESTTLPVDEDDETEHMIFAFELSAEDSDNDISLDNLFIDVMMGSTFAGADTLNELIDDFRIEIDGESFDAESYPGGGTTTTVEFDIDGDFEIEADEVATVLFFANFNDVDSGFTSATITASIDADDDSIDAEGADDITTVDGSDRDGDVHTVRLTGVVLASEPSDGTDSTDSEQIVSGVATDDNYGTMFLEFDITVFGDDVWVAAEDAVRGAASSTRGLAYEIREVGVGTEGGGTSTISYDIEGADEDNGYFELEEGNTYTVNVNIDNYNPDTTGNYRFQLNSIGFNVLEDTVADTAATPDDITEYRSDSVSIQS